MKTILLLFLFSFLSQTFSQSPNTAGDSTKTDSIRITKSYSESELDYPIDCLNFEAVRSTITYPASARSRGISGVVKVTLIINQLGFVAAIGKLTGPEIFHDEVRAAALKLKFTPGTIDGIPVFARITVPFTFTLLK